MTEKLADRLNAADQARAALASNSVPPAAAPPAGATPAKTTPTAAGAPAGAPATTKG